MSDSSIDNDAVVYTDAKEAASALDLQYRRAVRKEEWNKADALKPSVDEAYAEVSRARIKLLEPGTIASDSDLADMRKIRADIEAAAETQVMIQGAAALVGFLRKFV